jgi:ABC-type antimicrobial peptide transport system permease subunit
VAVSALRIIAIGAAVGLVLAALTSGLLSTMLYGVKPLDPLTIIGVVAVLGVTAAASVAAPAWRAARVDPVVALRRD